MKICGTFEAGQKSCLNCENFMFWGTSTGHCVIHSEDFLCSDACECFIEATDETRQSNRG